MKKNKITLYHYSNRDIKSINPEFFGHNNYTFNDLKVCNIKRTFFYTNKKSPEYILKNANYIYTVIIDKKNLYDLRTDKKNLKVKYNGDIISLLSYCKKYYTGIVYNVGFDIVSLFYSIKAYRKVKRVKKLV